MATKFLRFRNHLLRKALGVLAGQALADALLKQLGIPSL